MSQATILLDESAPQSNGQQQPRKRSQQRSRPGKSIPTDRMKFEVQQRALFMYGRLSGQDKKAVTAERVSQAMNKEISHHTVGLSNGFFVDAGWLEKRGRGEFAASDALVDYLRRLGADKENIAWAVEPLREVALGSWFWRCIKSQLEFSSSESELLHMLMSEAEAGSDHRTQLRNLLEWVEYVGLIRRTDGVVHLTTSTATTPVDLGAMPLHIDPDPTREEPPAMNRDMPATAQVQEPTTESKAEPPALMSFDFSCRVTAEDLAKLDPEQIQSLFAAVGTLMSLNAAAL